MALIDMQLPKRSKQEQNKMKEPCTLDQDKYPYGLKLHLEKQQIAKFISLKDVTAKTRLIIEAEASIVEIRTTELQDGKDSCTMEIQIEKLSIEPIKDIKDMSMKEYRASREK
jgi:hypothetical protein